MVQRKSQPLVYKNSRDTEEKVEEDLININLMNHFNPNSNLMPAQLLGLAPPLAPYSYLSPIGNFSNKEKMEVKSPSTAGITGL